MIKQIFGRYTATKRDNGFNVVIEDGSHGNSDYWLQVVDANSFPVGHIHFKLIAPGVFEIDQLRPLDCPMQDLSSVCKQFSTHL